MARHQAEARAGALRAHTKGEVHHAAELLGAVCGRLRSSCSGDPWAGCSVGALPATMREHSPTSSLSYCCPSSRNAHTCAHTHTHHHTHTYTHTPSHTCAHTVTHVYTPSHTHTYTHTPHTCAHTITHTHTCTHHHSAYTCSSKATDQHVAVLVTCAPS